MVNINIYSNSANFVIMKNILIKISDDRFHKLTLEFKSEVRNNHIYFYNIHIFIFDKEQLYFPDSKNLDKLTAFSQLKAECSKSWQNLKSKKIIDLKIHYFAFSDENTFPFNTYSK